jgi:geranylgeranyl diphosphate synthase type II
MLNAESLLRIMTDINQIIESLEWSKEPKGLYEPIGYALATGGKRIRPTLALIASELFGGREEDVLPAALALEIFHNFTLLHDDVMDRAAVRRGRPTVHVKWDDNTAILSGDQMLIEAYKQLAQVPSDKLPQVLDWFNEMATGICEGQQYDVDFEHAEHVAIADYMKMIELKTSVLLANALRTGAYIAGADKESIDALYAFGIHIGLAFQIQDDILDVYGDPKTFGKAIGGDICCNKKTLLLLTALEKAKGRKVRGEREDEIEIELEQWLQTTDRDAEKIAAVTAIYDRIGVRQAAEAIMEEHTAQALALLDKLPQNDSTERLRVMAEQLAMRKS